MRELLSKPVFVCLCTTVGLKQGDVPTMLYVSGKVNGEWGSSAALKSQLNRLGESWTRVE